MSDPVTPSENKKPREEDESKGICPQCVFSLFVMLGLIAFVIWLVFLKN